MAPSVSIVVPVYRVEAYLEKCVNSILAQTHRDFELILIDDGSPDHCGEICDSFARADSRIRVIHQPNQGLSVARNVGLEYSRGKYVGFVDSDDWVHSRYTEALFELAEKSSADISTCAHQRLLTEEERSVEYPGNLRVQSGNEVVLDLVEGRGQGFGSVETATAKLYDRRLFEQIRFPPGRLHEDEFTTYKLLLRADRVVRTDAELYMYRQRSDSIMASRSSFQSRMDAIDAFLERRAVLRSANLDYDDRSERSYLFAMFMRANLDWVQMTESERECSKSRLRATARRLLRIPQSPVTRVTYFGALISPGDGATRSYGLLTASARLRASVNQRASQYRMGTCCRRRLRPIAREGGDTARR